MADYGIDRDVEVFDGGASYYVAYGDTRLSAVEISSFEPLSEDDVLKIFALAVAEELEGE